MNGKSWAAGQMPAPDIEALIAEHGTLRVVAAVMRALVRRKLPGRSLMREGDLSDHMRRDIGLPHEVQRPDYRDHMR